MAKELSDDDIIQLAAAVDPEKTLTKEEINHLKNVVNAGCDDDGSDGTLSDEEIEALMQKMDF